MDAQSVLILTAELGIGIAGFAAVAVAVAAQGSGKHSSLQVAQVNTMMFGSLGVVFFAYLPMLISLGMLESSATWRVPSVLYLLWHSGFAYRLARGIPAWREEAGFSVRHTWFAVWALSISMSLNLYNAALPGTSWPYLASLACGLAIPSSRFVQIVGSLWSIEKGSS